MNLPEIFTEEEKEEFTYFNLAAFDNHRKVSADKGEIPPCWLCMTDEAKEVAKTALLEVLRGSLFLCVTEESAETLIMSKIPEPLLMAWAEAEAERKSGREVNDPHAWFAG